MSFKRNFIVNRLHAVKYAAKGFWILITTESSIQAQIIIAIIVTIAGFILNISATEWLFQIMAIGLVLVAESLNTALERTADFIHPNKHKKIEIIKDIAAGAVFFAAITAIIIGLIIYVPKLI